MMNTNSCILTPIHKGWRFRQASQSKWMMAEVPGCVHTDLQKNNSIDDPFFGINENRYQWIEYQDWEYETSFEISEASRSQENLEIIFQGLDTYASVYLNDELILEADNMYRSWTVDIKDKIKPGVQKLSISFKSPTNQVLPRLAQMNFRYHAVQDNAIEASPLTRKAPYHYGWDWGPRYVTSGIWRPIQLLAWSDLKLTQVFIKQEKLSDQKAELIAELSFDASKNHQDVRVMIINQANEQTLLDQTITINQGNQLMSLPFQILSPHLWWPVGYGEAYLYDLKVSIIIGKEVHTTQTLRIGLRTITLHREADQWGESFEFVVNGKSIFVKGANWIPADSFINQISDEHYHRLIQAARDANFNMLRVWGGGIYELDIFYDLCDEMGILVWQDFMFACSLVPADVAFLENVKQEAIQNIERLRNHASLALWCGNNENEWIYDFQNGGMQNRFDTTEEEVKKFSEEYDKLYHQLLKNITAKYDPTRSYWPSSPSSEGKAHANDDNFGDIHHWDVWHMGYDVEHYKTLSPRFISEFGFQGMPGPQTIDTYLAKDQRFLGSPAMATHQKHDRGYSLIKTYLEKNYPYPKDFDGFVYLSQVQQADYIKFAVEYFRSLSPKCMGILYWQFNDCWPVCSWSSVDYFGRWKALHYYARKFYAPILIYPQATNNQVLVQIIADQLPSKDLQLKWHLANYGGQVLQEEELTIEMTTSHSGKIIEIPITALFSKKDRDHTYISFSLLDQSQIVAENILFLTKIKDIQLHKCQITAKLTIKTNHILIDLKTDKFAKNVYLKFNGDDGIFEDNYFDLCPHQPKLITYKPRDLSNLSDLRISSMIDYIQ